MQVLLSNEHRAGVLASGVSASGVPVMHTGFGPDFLCQRQQESKRERTSLVKLVKIDSFCLFYSLRRIFSLKTLEWRCLESKLWMQGDWRTILLEKSLRKKVGRGKCFWLEAFRGEKMISVRADQGWPGRLMERGVWFNVVGHLMGPISWNTASWQE